MGFRRTEYPKIHKDGFGLTSEDQKKRNQDSKNPTEIHNYPKKSIIQYSEPGRSYTYKIIEEGYYPPATYNLKYTKGQSFQIPDNYEVETSWEKPKKLQTVRCLIKYVEKIQALNLEKKMRYSGPHFFGLHLEVLQQVRDSYQRATILK
ncbi:unnamed protein product [Rhizophagus irregularis]|nr:unnamed protein product [Rhizophagus irregularis]